MGNQVWEPESMMNRKAMKIKVHLIDMNNIFENKLPP